MPSNLAGGGVCIGQHSVCILRAAILRSDCSVSGGNNSGIVTAGIVTMTASADVEEGVTFEPKTGCGDIGWTYAKNDRVKRINLSGDLLFHDFEMMKVLFGGTLTLGAVGTDFAGLVTGWNELNISDPDPPQVYLEVISLNVAQGIGECQSQGVSVPYATGHIFGRCKLTLGDRTFENDVANVSFTGTSSGNPALFNGPWNDWPGVVNGSPYVPNSPRVQINYSVNQYNAILARVGCGYEDLPTGS
jgi:hypothetical protein